MNTAATSRQAPGPRARRSVALTRDGRRYIVREHIGAVIVTALALGAARTLMWKNAWLYGAMAIGVKLFSALVLTRLNPGVLNARGTRHDMSNRDRIFFAVFIPASFATTIVAGFDAGAPGWTHGSTGALVLGLALMTVGMGVVVWALVVNEFFEPTVRIQTDRGHRVCTTGPYRFVRHPGYMGAIIATVGVPLVLGSMWSFVPVAVIVTALAIRTGYEDRLLHAELEGYKAYAEVVRHRLLPPLW